RSRGGRAVGLARGSSRRARLRAGRSAARSDQRTRLGDSRQRGWPRADPAVAVIVYGRNPVREALRGRRARSVAGVWATASVAHEPWLTDVKTKVCGADELERVCGSSAHQGVCAEMGGYPYVGARELLAVDSPLIVALDQVQDPQNLGSICRTAECAGATGVVIPERRAAEVTPAACKASAGAVEHMRIARVRNIADFRGEAGEAVSWSYGASAPAIALDEAERGESGRARKTTAGNPTKAGPGGGVYTPPGSNGGRGVVAG